MRHGKKYIEASSKIEPQKKYLLSEAVHLVKEIARAKFDETIEIAMRLRLDPKQSDQNLRGTVFLPHGLGRKVKILVFAKGEKEKEAREAGADYVGNVELIEQIQKGWTDFDVAVATPDMMKEVGKLGKTLGTKGLMPNPKSGTVTLDVGRAVKEIKRGRIEYRVDKAGVIHAPLGKVSFEEGKILENASNFITEILRVKPSSVKGQYVRSITLSSTMGPGVKVKLLEGVESK